MYLMRCVVLLALISIGLPNMAHSHLLNMSKASLTHSNETLELTLTLDLTRALGSSERYFEWSRLAHSTTPNAQPPSIRKLLDSLITALDIRVGGHTVEWTLSKLVLPFDVPHEDFVSGLAWPMTTITLQAPLPVTDISKVTASKPTDTTATVLLARFSSTFAFEEPIALTMYQPSTQRSISRWLVRNQQSPEFSLSPQETATLPKATDTSITVALEYMWQGIIHILPRGWDHVLFVLGMFLGARKRTHLMLWVTGFTLAHTVTLGLAAFGAIEISAAIVEPIIMISIAWVAIENIVLRPSVQWRFALVTLFGLVHGLGFASVVKTLPMPSDNFTLALISFNVGVELAQLAVLAIAFMMLGYWWKKAYWHKRIVVPGSIIIAGLASMLLIA